MDIRACACMVAATAWLTACSGSSDEQTFREPTPNVPPTADFTVTPASGKVPLLGVAFDATRSNDTDGVISSYAWDFGDGNAGTGRTTTHDYMADGVFTVSLVVTDEDGDDSQNSSTATITVNPNEPPLADFAITPDTPLPSPANFTFDASAATDPDGQVVQYDWDFGDTQTATGSATNHTFTNNDIVPAVFTVTLTVTDDSGFTGDTTQNVTVLPVNKAPTASFTGCPITACDPPGTPPFFAPFIVTLLADGSNDVDGTIVQYNWDFGDGNTAEKSDPAAPDFTSQTYTYTESGTFTVELTVTDNFGATDSVSDDLTINNLPPVASFSAVLDPGAAPLTVNFDAQNSLDSDGDIARYDWEFGDGNTGTASVDLDPNSGNFGLIDPDTVAGVGAGDGITADHLYSTIGASIGTRGLPAPETSSIAVADVDGDGRADVVVGNYLQANHLFLATDSPLQTVESADITDDLDGTLDIALADVNGDGRPDLVTANGGIDVVPVPVGEVNKVYLWNAVDEKFDSGVPIVAGELDVSTSVAVADVDGDNVMDLVIGNAASANKLYIGNAAGGFFPGTEIEVGEMDNTSDIILADMDMDGNLDVLAANLGSPNRLYLGDGAGGFASGTDISMDVQASAALAASDLDADGDIDVVVGNAGTGEINRYYLNQCDGSCAPGTDVFAGVTGMDITEDQEISTSVYLADVDADSDVDLVVGNALEPTRLYINYPNGTSFGDVIFSERLVDNPSCDPQVEASCTCDVNAPDDVACAAEAVTSGEFLLEGNTSSVLIADLDANAAPDLFAGSFGGENTVFLSGCSGNCADTNPYASSFPTAFPDNGANDIAIGDIDGDGDLDMVTATRDEANQVILGTANVGFALTRYLVGSDAEDSRDVELADMDGDGDLDLLVGNAGQTNKYYPNTCNGVCAPDSDVFAGMVYDVDTDLANTASISVGDVDGDGDLDLVTGNGVFGNQPNRVFLNRCVEAGGCLMDENVFDRSDVGVDSEPLRFDIGGAGDLFNTQGIVLGDLDGDGDLDAVTANADQQNYFYANTCGLACAADTNPFDVPGVAIEAGSTLSSRSVALGDFDNNGNIDLVFGNSGTPNRVFLNPLAAFPSMAGRDVGEDADQTFSVAVGDINGDGFADVLAGNEGANRLYYGDPGGGSFTSASLGIDITTDDDGTRVIKVIDIGDLGSDGRLDVLVGNLGAPIKIYYNDGRHIARLTVTDNAGDSSTTAVEIVIP